MIRVYELLASVPQSLNRPRDITGHDIRIDLGRLDTCMAELLLHQPKVVLAGLVEQTGIGVTKAVDRVMRGEPCERGQFLEDVLEGSGRDVAIRVAGENQRI